MDVKRIPWRKLHRPEPDHRYVVSLGVFVIDRRRHVPAFVRHSARVRRIVRRTPGLVGYALIADFRARAFTEMAAFESREAMRAFVAQPGHQAAMRAVLPHIAPGSKIVSIEMYGRDLPPRPEAATAALEAVTGIEELGRHPGRTMDRTRPDHTPGTDAGASGLGVARAD